MIDWEQVSFVLVVILLICGFVSILIVVLKYQKKKSKKHRSIFLSIPDFNLTAYCASDPNYRIAIDLINKTIAIFMKNGNNELYVIPYTNIDSIIPEITYSYKSDDLGLVSAIVGGATGGILGGMMGGPLGSIIEWNKVLIYKLISIKIKANILSKDGSFQKMDFFVKLYEVSDDGKIIVSHGNSRENPFTSCWEIIDTLLNGFSNFIDDTILLFLHQEKFKLDLRTLDEELYREKLISRRTPDPLIIAILDKYCTDHEKTSNVLSVYNQIYHADLISNIQKVKKPENVNEYLNPFKKYKFVQS